MPVLEGGLQADENLPTEPAPTTPGIWTWVFQNGTGRWQDLTKVAATPTTNPVPVTRFGNRNIRPRWVDLNWDYPTSPTIVPDEFLIDRSRTANFARVDQVYRILGGSSRGTTLKNLTPGTTYYFRIKAAKGTAESTTVDQNITTQQVSSLSSSARTETSITLEWTADNYGSGSYRH